MRKTKNLLLVVLLLFTLPMSVHAVDDPFDIGPIEPFEDTPDWKPEEEPGQPPEEPPAPDPADYDGRRQIRIAVNSFVLKKTYKHEYGELVMDYTLRLYGLGNRDATRPVEDIEYIAGFYEGNLEFDFEGEVKLKGMGNIPGLKIDNKIKGDFDETDIYFWIHAVPPDPGFDKQMEKIHEMINKVNGTSSPYRRLVATGEVNTKISGTGSLDILAQIDAGSSWSKGEHHSTEKNSQGVRVEISLIEGGIARVMIVIPGVDPLYFFDGIYEILSR